MNIFRRVKYFVQRGRRGYSNEDLWDFGDYLNRVIANGLRSFTKENIGYPEAMGSFEAWQAKLGELADVIAPKEDDRVGETGSEWYERSRQEHNARTAALKELAEWWGWLWW